jgi:hypothetical protein
MRGDERPWSPCEAVQYPCRVTALAPVSDSGPSAATDRPKLGSHLDPRLQLGQHPKQRLQGTQMEPVGEALNQRLAVGGGTDRREEGATGRGICR